jgi:hypothetical protein
MVGQVRDPFGDVLRGGEYLFLPSLSALRWLADLL